MDDNTFVILDGQWEIITFLPRVMAENTAFDLATWYEDQLINELEKYRRKMKSYAYPAPDKNSRDPDDDDEGNGATSIVVVDSDQRPTITVSPIMDKCPFDACLELYGVQVPRGTYPAVQRNAAVMKEASHKVPKPVVITAKINGQPARALLDSGSLGDFMSSTIADQLKVKKEKLALPLGLQLAVQGLCFKIDAGAVVEFEYQKIKEKHYFDIINLSSYDLILGTPWLYQHQVCLGFNPARVLVGSDMALLLNGLSVTSVALHAVALEHSEIDRAQRFLLDYTDPLCKDASETELPPLQIINHSIPLIDENKIYPWHPSRCPKALRSQWVEKKNAYLKTGRWEITNASNTIPMLLVIKPRKPGDPPLLRTVYDLHARNDNTHKMMSPLPDPEGILRRAARHRFQSMIDGKDAYEQIRIAPEHVHRTATTTPDSNMISHVIQQGDCNAPTTYQALMNQLFSPYIGQFMDVYLDDIIIYSDSIKDHVEHVNIVIDILTREKLYLSKKKLYFLCPEMKILGCVVSDNGIRMDPYKVDSVLVWKTPTNRDLLQGFLGSIGYLAEDIPNVRIPMGVLHGLTSDTVPFHWGFTEQRAFEDVKALVQAARNHNRVPLDYASDAPQVWMVTDGCSTGVAGLVSQGKEWKSARIAAFYSAKLNLAQQNYPVHKIEMLAGVETMLHHCHILQGIKFKWVTDHKGLEYLLNQKNLSSRQA